MKLWRLFQLSDRSTQLKEHHSRFNSSFYSPPYPRDGPVQVALCLPGNGLDLVDTDSAQHVLRMRLLVDSLRQRHFDFRGWFTFRVQRINSSGLNMLSITCSVRFHCVLSDFCRSIESTLNLLLKCCIWRSSLRWLYGGGSRLRRVPRWFAAGWPRSWLRT